MRYAQLVIGPAGSGKSTYCSTIVRHCENIGRTVHVVNLDPAAEYFDYPVLVDTRELVQLEDVMEAEDLKLGPNGGLVFCMEYLIKNMEWLEEQLGYSDEDYFIFDCPGQIELYSHIPVMRQFVETLQQWDIRVCGVFLVDSKFMVNTAMFFSGVLAALSAMVQLEIPHINVMSKMDLLSKDQASDIERFLDPNPRELMEEAWQNKKYQKLNIALAQVIDDFSMVQFVPLNNTDEESVTNVLLQIDNAIQYGEDLDVKDKDSQDDNRDDFKWDGNKG
ncbi:GPN-loop GTPase 3-like [Dendronephthya gigantea]|uniref:GPN-loop GTPase 3-like n=1 Tax=Dendronephthya gigantea TaxID=151771 RepID=UPI00106AE359|nr:GPN-loop GTPase 3-like [Dendronephthya gigantea]